MLKEKNVAILFEEENINIGSGQGELVLTLLSAMAQQESENISSYVLIGLKMKKDRGELIGYNGCYGYNYNLETKEITINEEEANIVRYMFERYVEGVGSSTIAKELTAKGIKTPKHRDKWCESTVRGILKNEKYIGDVLMGKTFTIDPIYCGFCGSLLTRRNWNANKNCAKAVWQCIKRTKHGKEECPHCKAIPEEILEDCFVQGYRILCNDNKKVVENFLEKIENILKENTTETMVTKLENNKEKIINPKK